MPDEYVPQSQPLPVFNPFSNSTNTPPPPTVVAKDYDKDISQLMSRLSSHEKENQKLTSRISSAEERGIRLADRLATSEAENVRLQNRLSVSEFENHRLYRDISMERSHRLKLDEKLAQLERDISDITSTKTPLLVEFPMNRGTVTDAPDSEAAPLAIEAPPVAAEPITSRVIERQIVEQPAPQYVQPPVNYAQPATTVYSARTPVVAPVPLSTRTFASPRPVPAVAALDFPYHSIPTDQARASVFAHQYSNVNTYAPLEPHTSRSLY
eukprot:NODE_5432_length_1015_cov_44.487668_g4863_i0.p1 GENE.NODE_5432_length_1015_cov_44.487668_g4863_i0~~NODE_5432_length_1015_cov_44.487668_g4863_i0.p1  ORF type:complete len:268 (+),score=46.56 NODE_5432_length_1015_cov_44.487668_g4863_i0:80-883(+)